MLVDSACEAMDQTYRKSELTERKIRHVQLFIVTYIVFKLLFLNYLDI